MKRLFYYLKIWWLMSKNSFMTWLAQKMLLLIFLTGKLMRFAFFAGFLYFIIKGAKSLAGYNAPQVIFFFLTFNLIDIITQFLFREVYRFRPLIVSGDFDLVLTKPYSSLFRSLMGGADLIDLITIPPLVFAVIYIGALLNPSWLQTILYLLLLVNGFLIATAFHIAVLSLAIITLEIDHLVMIYRDLTNLGRFPIDIYKEPLKGILTYLIPVGVMISVPAKALMGLISIQGIVVSFAIGILLILLSFKLWHFALTKYSSASS